MQRDIKKLPLKERRALLQLLRQQRLELTKPRQKRRSLLAFLTGKK